MSSRTAGAGRRALGVLTTAGLLAAGCLGATAAPALAAPPTDAPGQVKKAERLGSADQERLQEAREAGDQRVTVMITAPEGGFDQAKRDVLALGGALRYEAPSLGYFSAVVPTGKVEQTADLASVSAIDLDEVVPLPEVGAVDGVAGAQGTAPGASTPDANAYMPTYETGSTDFKKAHPTWDGRGTTIGVIDSGIDLAHPALQTTSTGERKIVDTFTATDPVTEGSLVAGGDATWLPMVQDATGPTFGPYRGSTWTLPAGSFKIRTFDESGTNVTGGEVLGDVNRDGDKTDRFGVLLDQTTNEVIVDSDDDKDFTDEKRMRPFRERFDQGVFGADKAETGVVDAMPFTVDVREDRDISSFGIAGFPAKVDFVDIGIVSGAHGSHVAGITAANDMFGGAMDGQAPGAKLVSARACSFGPGCTAAALTDGMAELAANRGVDVINMSIGGLPALNDGDNARAVLYNRIIAKGVQLVISAGNSGNALNTIGDPSVATDVISVGASISKATWAANYGAVTDKSYGMLTFSSGGPREDGGFKPNVVAPGSAISTTPTWQAGGPVAEAGYVLPSGYSMFNGTSMASPQAAGVVSLMLSAAKAEGLKATSPAALRNALYSSAVPVKDVPVFLQGHGLVDVNAAYALLQKGATPASTFAFTAPVCTEVWRILGETSGTGLYNRCAVGAGGQAAGETRAYDVTVTRTTGPKTPGKYDLSVVGNDGTFSVTPNNVALPLGQPIKLKVRATPTPGAHSAILRVDDASTLGHDASMMMAVVAGSTPAAPSFTTTAAGTSDRNQAVRHYVTVPAGTKALELSLSGTTASTQTRFLAFHPYGLPIDSTASTACYSNRGTDGTCNSAKRAYANPQPGIWEVLVETRRTSPVASTPYTLGASLLGVTVSPAERTVSASATVLSWTVKNDFGTVDAVAKGSTLGSALTAKPTIADHAVQTRTIEVPAGAERLDVSIGSPSDTGADLDLTVTGPSGTRSSADGDSEEAVSFPEPKPGTYTVTIDGYAVPAGTTSYTYRDVFTSPSLGTLTVDDSQATLAAGATRTVNGVLDVKSTVAPGRSLFGAMRFFSGSGALLGTGSVTVG